MLHKKKTQQKKPNKTKPHNKAQPQLKGNLAKSIQSNKKEHFKCIKNRKFEYL